MKITEYQNLCIYLQEEDKKEFVHNKMKDAIASKYYFNSNKLVVRYKDYHGGDYQENWWFANPSKTWLGWTIAGIEVWELRFLDGKYSSEDIMFALSRVKMGKYEAEAI